MPAGKHAEVWALACVPYAAVCTGILPDLLHKLMLKVDMAVQAPTPAQVA